MHAKEQMLVQLLEGQKQYAIPLYQRTYSWQRDQLRQLWDDVMAQADLLRDGVSAPGHFMGSLVLAPSKAVVGGPQRWLVVDGQQRLTTLTVALCAVRDHIRSESPRQAERIHRQHLVNEYLEGPERPKVVPTQDDRASYAAVLEGDPGEAVGNVADAYRFFREQLVAADDPDDRHDITRIEQAILHRLDLVAITADPDDNVHRIFQSLNNTGMRLTQGDLLRNHYFMLLPTRADEVYQTVWRPMEKRLGVANLETLALLDLQLHGVNANRGDAYRLQAERLRSVESDEAAVAADISRLARRADALAPVLDPSQVSDEQLRSALERLKAWGAEASQVVMLAAMERHAAGTASRDQVMSVASYAESYLVRRMLVGRTASGLNRILADTARAMLGADDIAVQMHRFLSTPRRAWPTDTQVRSEIQTRNFYWSGRQAQRMMVLRRLEHSFPTKEPVDWAASSPTIEHILPQALTPEWEAGLEDPDDPTLPPEDVHELWTHRLGNLTLTGYNSELSNAPFETKRQVYAQSNFAMTRQLAEVPQWGTEEIRARAEDLAERAIAIWPGPLDLGPAEASDPWRIARRVLVALPEGTWTTYGDLAAVCGTAPVPMGSFLANTPNVPNAWRVLNADGKVSTGFRWSDGRTESAHDVLAGEGVRFGADGAADPEQRLRAVDLAELLGIDTGAGVPAPEAADQGQEHAEGVWLLLRVSRRPEIVEGLSRLVQLWASLGGTLQYALDPQPALFFTFRQIPSQPWLFGMFLRGRGYVEVPFQYLKIRPPFDDTGLREHLMDRCNAVPGVQFDRARIGLRPNFRLELLADPAVIDGLIEVQKWFVDAATGLEALGSA